MKKIFSRSQVLIRKSGGDAGAALAACVQIAAAELGKENVQKYICAILAPTEPSCSGLSSAPHSSVTSARPAPGELAKCVTRMERRPLARVRESFDQILCRAGIGEEEDNIVFTRW